MRNRNRRKAAVVAHFEIEHMDELVRVLRRLSFGSDSYSFAEDPGKQSGTFTAGSNLLTFEGTWKIRIRPIEQPRPRKEK